MNKKFYSAAGLVFLVAAFLLFNMVNSMIFSGWRVDLTESRLFTLSDGTEQILEEIDEGVLMRVEVHPIPGGGIKKLLFPIIRNSIAKGLSSGIREIKRLAEQSAAA